MRIFQIGLLFTQTFGHFVKCLCQLDDFIITAQGFSTHTSLQIALAQAPCHTNEPTNR